jgi:hypothetical protein
MRAVISTDLILRLIHATPEQYASVERVLGISGSDGWTPAATDDEARKLFALLKSLESEASYNKAPVTRVFLLYCHESLSRKQVAKACGCSVSLVKERLKTIERKLGRKVSELRNLALDFDGVAEPVADSRARRIKPQHSLDDTDSYEDE